MDQRRNGNKRASQEAMPPTRQEFSNPKLGSEIRKRKKCSHIRGGIGAACLTAWKSSRLGGGGQKSK